MEATTQYFGKPFFALLNLVYGDKKIFYSGPSRVDEAEQKYLVPAHDELTEPITEGPRSYVLLVLPIWISFNSQQEPPLS